MLTHFIQNISSYDGNVLLAAVISLLLVILFVLLLHIYAKWFLQQARDRRRLRRTTNSISVLPHVLRPPRFHPFAFDITTAGYSSKGLDPSIIASIPLFVYSKKQQKEGDGGGGFEFEFDCVICLSGFEENEIGRCLTKCGHGFHVECIDMWLSSHSNCPICRAPVVAGGENSGNDCGGGGGSDDSVRAGVELVEIVVGGGDDVDQGSRLDNGVIGDGAANRDQGGDHDHDHGGGEPECSAAEALGCSLKRMLSRKRSDQCCCKVFSSSNSVNNSVSQDRD